MKLCKRCGESRQIDQFPRDPRYRGGHSSWCKPCSSSYNNERQKKNPDKSYDQHLRRRYGITLEDYQAISAIQNHLCAVCQNPSTSKDRSGKTKRLEVHHNHETGRVVALLCWNCNTGMGKFGDDPDLMRRAAAVHEGQVLWTSSTK